MPDNKDLKVAIKNALTAFEKKPLAEASLDLLGTLGYRSERRLRLMPNSADQFRAEFDAKGLLNPESALVSNWKSVDLLIQVTDDEIREAIKGAKDMFASKKMEYADIRSYLFFAVELKGKQYTRTQLAGITREINKLFPMPVMVIFRYDEVVSLAIIARRINKRDGSKDVLEKVTLIKDIRFTGNRAQIEILHDLAISQLMQDYAISNFVDLQHAWEKTLDLNELNKKFYKEIANWYFWAVKTVKFPKDAEKDEATRNATGVIRLITRLIFVWFIKEKGLVPEELFDERWLKDTLKFEDPKKSTYYKAILQNLFFATLNTEMGEGRMFRRKNTGGLDPDYLMSNYYRYKHYFRNPEQGFKIFAGIPFLNGGLFECLDKEIEKGNVIRVDGFSDRDDNPLTVPDDLFLMEKEKEIDLNEVYDTKNKKYKVRGLIHIFNSYKFTIEENTPIEEEIALDPELLGKVFENLLAAYNPETGTTARKQTGSFYTPREIVNYMVDEALLAYLNAEGAQSGQNAEFEERLRDLLSYNPNPPAFSDVEKTRLIAAIDNVKVLDPAAGSGAFPMGVLHKLVFLLTKLDPDNERWKQKQIDNTQALDAVVREAQIKVIEEIFADNHNDDGRKLYLIENCIYGVDIQPIAVQIAKLRFFISLVVDQKKNVAKPNLGILQLPNLETKFVAANTLIGINRPDTKSMDEAPASTSPEVEEACEMLIRKLEQYLKSRNPDLRARYVQEAQEFADVINAGMGADFQPLAVDWVFSTANGTAALKALLPGKREAKASPMILRNQQIEEKEKELERVRREHFSARTPAAKRKARDLDKKLRLEIADLLSKNHALEDETAQQLAGWDPYNQNAHADFFDPEWMFGVEGGFDVVIGNPPYVNAKAMQLNDPDERLLLKNTYSLLTDKWDLYIAFLEKGMNLSSGNSTVTMIIPNAFVKENYSRKIREYLIHNKLAKTVVFYEYSIFEASVSNIVLVIQKPKAEHHKQLIFQDAITFTEKEVNIENIFASTDTLLDRFLISETTLGDVCFISVGMVLNASETVAQGEFIKDDLVSDKKDKIHCKRYTEGKWIDKYQIETIKYLEWGTSRVPSKIRRVTFPELYEKEKILVNKLGNIKAAYDNSQIYCDQTIRVLIKYDELKGIENKSINNSIQKFSEKDRSVLENISKGFRLKFILALLNSTFYNYLLDILRTKESFDLNPLVLRKLPIPNAPVNTQKSFEYIADKILTAKRADPQADTSALEGEIDQLVYQLYGLSEDEVRIVEGR